MIFYLGTHETSWLTKTDVPLFISHRRLARRQSLPRALGPWALDSGGFSELALFGRWQTRPEEYVAACRRYRDEIGNLAWCAPQDWMCEPVMLAKTGYTVHDHQMLTIESYLTLSALAPDVPYIPVLQGWQLADYLHHVDMYRANGVDLTAHDVVGVGSVCRRQATGEIARLIRDLAATGIRLHGFGMKTKAFRSDVICHLTSADSLAWSYNARRNPPLPGCRHEHCASCLRWALAWRDRVLGAMDGPRQMAMAL